MSTTTTPPPIITNSSNPVIKDLLNKYSKSPLPAWALTTGIAMSPLLRPVQSKLSPYPSNVQVAVFSSFIGLGGFMVYDNDLVNGSAVVAVWSTLYTLSNWKKALWNFKLYPKVLASLALVNAGVYGLQATSLL